MSDTECAKLMEQPVYSEALSSQELSLRICLVDAAYDCRAFCTGANPSPLIERLASQATSHQSTFGSISMATMPLKILGEHKQSQASEFSTRHCWSQMRSLQRAQFGVLLERWHLQLHTVKSRVGSVVPRPTHLFTSLQIRSVP